jgi:hypothetical protein
MWVDREREVIAPPFSTTGQGRVWPYAIGGASIAVAAEGLVTLVNTFAQFGVAALVGRGSSLGSLLRGSGSLQIAAQLVPSLFHPVLCVLLLAAGILLLRRSRLAVRLHVAYAIATIVLAVVPPLLAAPAMPRAPTTGPHYGDFFFFYLWFRVISATTKLLVYPIFLLVWFRRPAIRSQIAQWRR